MTGEETFRGIMTKKLVVLFLSLCMLCACGKNKVIGIPETTERQPEPAVVAGMDKEFYSGLAIGLVIAVVGMGLTWYFANKIINRQSRANMIRTTSAIDGAIQLMDATAGLQPPDHNRIRNLTNTLIQEQDPGKSIKEYQNCVGQYLKAYKHFSDLHQDNVLKLCTEAINILCWSAIQNPIFNDIPDTLLLLRNYIQQTCARTRTAFNPNAELAWPQVLVPPQEVAQ
jgi:hypothetical protein